MGIFVLLLPAAVGCIQTPAQKCAKSLLCSLSSPIMARISPGCHTIPPYKLGSNIAANLCALTGH
jgi:hypothetical protein